MNYVHVKQEYRCMECEKTAPMDWIMCGTCGDYNGIIEMPAGWKYWPLPSNQLSWPKPVICDECIDEDAYLREVEKVKKSDAHNKCSECGSPKQVWFNVT